VFFDIIYKTFCVWFGNFYAFASLILASQSKARGHIGIFQYTFGTYGHWVFDSRIKIFVTPIPICPSSKQNFEDFISQQKYSFVS